MNRIRTSLSIGLVALFLLAGCSVEETISHPACDGGGSWVIVTQSVPSASKVPCLDPLPRGWHIETVEIDETGTTIEFTSDRAGSIAARMSFAASCEVGEAISTPSDDPDVERFETIVQLDPEFLATRYYRFADGCVWWDFEFDAGAPSAHSIDLTNSMKLFDRVELQRLLAETFLDEEL